MQSLRRRIKALEQIGPKPDGPYTWEEVCRFLWLSDKAEYLKLVEQDGHHIRHFVVQFEREDAEQAAR